MRYHALACDYDGTIAHHGRVDAATVQSLSRLRASGRRLLLVTGRQLEDLRGAFEQIGLFDRLVLENGAVIVDPSRSTPRALAGPPPPYLVDELERRGVRPISVGRVIVATWEPHHGTTLEVIRDLGLELQVVFNKGAVMVLPSGINKAVGLREALLEIGLSPHNVVGVGDAENDHAMFDLCELSVAVSNAVPRLKEHADFVTEADHGAGVQALVAELLRDDLRTREVSRRSLVLGCTPDGVEVKLPAYAAPVLIAGTSGSGKSRLARGMLEQLTDQEYQYCVVDPEGDYTGIPGPTLLGDAENVPPVGEVLEVLEQPGRSVVANLLGVPMEDRPERFNSLLSRLFELRSRTGRPHWFVVDEAHHVLPDSLDPTKLILPKQPHGLVLLTAHPRHTSSEVLSKVGTVVVIGSAPATTLRDVAESIGVTPPPVDLDSLAPGHGWVWRRDSGETPEIVEVGIRPPRSMHRRHVRKYAIGELGPDVSFHFRGPEGKLKLRAHNLAVFIRLAEGVDDATWRFHLQRGDYSQWFRERIKDAGLAAEVQTVEQARGLSDTESRARVKAAIERRYSVAS